MTRPLPAPAARSGASFDPARAYRLHPKVALRPERFGALAYSYTTRRLSLLKDPDLVTCVRSLGDHPSAAAAVEALDAPPAKKPAVQRALARLVRTGFVVERR